METSIQELSPAAAGAARSPSVPWLRVGLRTLAGVIVVVVLVGCLQILWARHHLTEGAHDLNLAIGTVRSPAALRNPVFRAITTQRLASARSQFGGARNDLVLWQPLLARAGWVPHFGGELVAAAPAASAAYFATSSALDLVHGLNGLWSAIGDRSHGRPLLVRLATALAPGRADFGAAQSSAAQGVRSLRLLPVATGSLTVDQAMAKLRRDLPKLGTAGQWLALVPNLLGADAPASYLFCWENSAEIRAVGGFIGASDLVTVRRGSMRRHFTGSVLPHEISFPDMPTPEAVLTAESDWLFRDSNFSPDYPLSARLERWFYGEDTGVWVDGVVDIVDRALPDILQATGPVYVPEFRVLVDARNAEALANRFAGPQASPSQGSPASRDAIRKRFLGFEFQAIISRLQTLPIAQWPRVGAAFAYAVQHRDILIYDRQPAVERAIHAVGADGSMAPARGDYLYIVDDNRSYNKIAPYVRESASYSTEILPNMWMDSTVRIHYHLLPSPATLEGQGPRFGLEGSKHDFLDFLRVYAPPGTVFQTMSGLKRFTPDPAQAAYGLTQVAGYFLLREGRSTTVTIQYQIPANALSTGGFRRYILTVPRQPGATLTNLSISVAGVDGVRLIAAGRSTAVSSYRTSFSLSTTRTLTLGLEGGSHPQLVTMPPTTQQDPFIPWGAFRGRRPL